MNLCIFIVKWTMILDPHIALQKAALDTLVWHSHNSLLGIKRYTPSKERCEFNKWIVLWKCFDKKKSPLNAIRGETSRVMWAKVGKFWAKVYFTYKSYIYFYAEWTKLWHYWSFEEKRMLRERRSEILKMWHKWIIDFLFF